MIDKNSSDIAALYPAESIDKLKNEFFKALTFISNNDPKINSPVAQIGLLMAALIKICSESFALGGTVLETRPEELCAHFFKNLGKVKYETLN